MRIGLSFDLKETVPLGQSHPEDALEEYDSSETVEVIAAAIETEGHTTVKLGGGRNFIAGILHERVDLVFNIAEGLGNYRSREAQVPSVLELLNIPYSGSDPQTLAICLDKPLTKQLVAAAGITTPKWLVLNNSRELAEVSWEGFPFPAFVKPAWEGSSKGIRRNSLAETPQKASELVKTLLDTYCQPVMVEQFITGDEVTVGIAGNTPAAIVGIMRILPRKREKYFIYSLEVKRDWEALVEYECPARLAPATLQEIQNAGLKAFKVLGCRDLSRMDFRIDRTGKPYFLEINPLPGLNSKSGDIVIMAKKMGWTYQALIGRILNAALERYPQCVRR
ncbi:MAG: D-alanine--D-alanine ligase [Dehalococcoidales bacterium]|nr:D-alanine--D-alanine ligase [Dehalococcoidales bacterium]